MPLTTCPGCLHLETAVIALHRRLHDVEQRLQALARRLDQAERRRTGSGALTLTGRHGQNGPPGAGAGPGPGGE